MSSLKIDDKETKREKLRYLLRLLSLGKLSREYAGDLKALLMDELKDSNRTQNDMEYEKELHALIKILDGYLLGEIDLMMHPDNLIVSNLT